MQLHQLLEASARRAPESVALVEPQRTTSYRELDQLANRFGHVFVKAGVCRHDRIVLALENSRELVAAYFGALKAGAVAVATVAFDDGRVTELQAGSLFYVPPVPHDSWVVGDVPYVSLHLLGADHYAKRE